MEKIYRIINDRFNVNSYIYKENNKCIIIDSNINTYDYIIKNELIPEYIFLTHEHFDHIIGVSRLKNTFPDIKVVASRETSDMMQDNKGNMSFYYDGIGIQECGADIFIDNISEFVFSGYNINTYFAPGHTSGGILIEINNLLFTGDTLLDIKTPTNLPTSSKKQLYESLEFIDEKFNQDIVICQGHGGPFLKKDWNKNTSIGNRK